MIDCNLLIYANNYYFCITFTTQKIFWGNYSNKNSLAPIEV